jgi:hypothetical protein
MAFVEVCNVVCRFKQTKTAFQANTSSRSGLLAVLTLIFRISNACRFTGTAHIGAKHVL